MQATCAMPGCAKPHRAKGCCSTHYNQTRQPHRHRKLIVACAGCGLLIERSNKRDRRPTCSVDCRTVLQHGTGLHVHGYDWARLAAGRARRAGSTIVELFDRITVFERDNWTCGICHEPVAQGLDPYDPLSATVDHIVPLAHGGEHTQANVQCAHLGCNSAKQDTEYHAA